MRGTGDLPDEAAGPTPEELLAWVDAGRLPRTPLRPCNYLPGRLTRERAFLAERLDPGLYHELMDRGFRRSGDLFYATACPDCRACVPLRVPVATFRPSRSQRRVLRRNQDVDVQVRRPLCSAETFALYRRYLQHQHGKSMDDGDEAGFAASLYARVVDTREVIYSLGGRTVAISLVDVSAQSVSAVYHFYEPADRDRSLGVFSVLAEIEWARQQGVPFYYLGFWITGCKTMAYKADYGPHELLRDGGWRAP
ncbi:MAG: arginyltransferase [Planctomycetota bacterium]